MEKVLKDILVPIDFEKPSLNALKFAANFAKESNSKITILNVLETPGILSEFFASNDQIVKLVNQIKDKLDKLASDTKKEHPDLKITTRVERGKAYKKILEVINDTDPRMVILGENHQGEYQEKNLGTSVYQITLQSSAPVLTLKGNVTKFGKKIIVPLDLTKSMGKKLFSAVAYGLNYNAEIHLVSALIGGISMKESRIYKKMKDAERTLKENNVKCTTALFKRTETPPYKRVLEYAAENNAEMILIMTHMEGYTNDNYIGAFAHHIINESNIPVLSLTSSASAKSSTSIITTLVDPANVLKQHKK